MLESLFERLVVAVEGLLIESRKRTEIAGNWVQVELQETQTSVKEMPDFKKLSPGSLEEEPIGVTSFKTYEQLLEEHGLPYLKGLCEKREINFPKLARSNTIIALLKDSDKEAGLPGSCLPETKEAATPGPETSTPADRGFNTWADNIPKENRKKEFSAMLKIVNSEISGMSK